MDSTGEVCAQFFKNQKCNFGNFCKHKHIKKDEDRKDTSLVDVKACNAYRNISIISDGRLVARCQPHTIPLGP